VAYNGPKDVEGKIALRAFGTKTQFVINEKGDQVGGEFDEVSEPQTSLAGLPPREARGKCIHRR